MREIATRAAAVIAFTMWAGASAPVGAEIIDRVLAVVQGAVITQSDATAASEMGLVTVAPSDDPLGAILSKLIDRELMLVEVERYAPAEPSEAAIDQRLQSVRARLGTPQAYAAALARSGFDEGQLRRVLRDQLRIEAYLDQRFAGDRRDDLVAEWVSSLRRRADISYLYVARR